MNDTPTPEQAIFAKLEAELNTLRAVKAQTRAHLIKTIDAALDGEVPTDWIDLKTLIHLGQNEKIAEAKLFGAITPLLKTKHAVFTTTVELPDRETERHQVAEQIGHMLEVFKEYEI